MILISTLQPRRELAYKFSQEYKGGVWWVPQCFWRRVYDFCQFQNKTERTNKKAKIKKDGNLGKTKVPGSHVKVSHPQLGQPLSPLQTGSHPTSQ